MNDLYPCPPAARGFVRCDLCGDRMQYGVEWRFVTVEAEHASGCAHVACYVLSGAGGISREHLEAWLSTASEAEVADLVRSLSPVEQARAADLWARRQGVAS